MAKEKEQAGWEYKPGKSAEQSQTIDTSPSPATSKSVPSGVSEFSWQATEFADHNRPLTWYLSLLVVTGATAGVVYLLTKDKISAGVAVVLGGMVLVAAFRKPRSLQCTVSSSGIRVADKNYTYGQFKSFGILREVDLPSLELYSVKKLLPPVTMYFNPQDEKQITDIVGNYLPYEDRKMAGIDKLAHLLRI